MDYSTGYENTDELGAVVKIFHVRRIPLAFGLRF